MDDIRYQVANISTHHRDDDFRFRVFVCFVHSLTYCTSLSGISYLRVFNARLFCDLISGYGYKNALQCGMVDFAIAQRAAGNSSVRISLCVAFGKGAMNYVCCVCAFVV